MLKKQAEGFIDSFKGFEKLEAGAFDCERTLVLVVDMVKGFCTEGALASANCNGIAGGIAAFLSSLKHAKTAFIRDCHKHDSIEFGAFPPHCLFDSSESELVDELKGFEGIDIEKNSTNAFFALSKKIPDLFDRFDRFVLVGVCTDICVLQLALSLKTAINEGNFSGKEVAVVSNLTQTFDLGEGHPSGLMNLVAWKLMEASGVRVVE